MAAYEIQKHFKGLRVETGNKKGRNPFATGFESDSDEEARRRSRARERSANSRKQGNIPVSGKPASAPKPSGPVKTSILDQLREDSDDDFLAAVPRTHRRPSPAPKQGVASLRVSDGASKRRGSSLHSGKAPRAAVALAAGTLAYLDDSSDDESAVASSGRRPRRASPGPRKQSDQEPSQTRTQPPQHTVASAFAGTKYLQDSESDEEAVSSRKNSAASEDSNTSPSDISGEPLSPYESALAPRHPDVKRVDKPKKLTANGGSGVSWRAFSASRSEQRNTEIEALQASLKQRGKRIAFGTHALTDDGERIPIPATPDVCTGKNGFAKARGRGRGKSPPRRAEDIKPAKAEVDDGPELLRQCQPLAGTYDPNEYRSNPLPGKFGCDVARAGKAAMSKKGEHSLNIALQISPLNEAQATITPSRLQTGILQSSALTTSPPPLDESMQSPTMSPTTMGGMVDSNGSILSKLNVSPQTIPEGQTADHSVMSPSTIDDSTPCFPSRDSSVRSRRQRMPPSSRRSSRRSMSANASASPAAQFLSSFSRSGDAEPAPELVPDDEGQEFEIDGERYVIGKKLNQGGFGVIKEAHSITAHGARISLAVKIVRKSNPDRTAVENEQAQEALEHEVSVWRHLDHRHVLRLRSVFSTDFATFCLMDLNVGGTLLDAVRKAKRSSISENSGRRGIDVRLAKKYAFQLASALRYLHQDVRVCHRDVKLENCLLDMTVPNAARDGGLLRLCDFGLADFLDSDTSNVEAGARDDYRAGSSRPSETNAPSHASVIGTLQYASPRGLSVDRKLYETPGDVWAFGVIVYALCTGDMPFRGGMDAQIVQAIMSEPWPENALKQAAQGSGDEVVIDLVKGCLEKDIHDRLTIGEALMSPWFEGCVEDGDNMFC